MNLSGEINDAILFLHEWQNDQTKYISAHTSGSTGEPKPIELLKSDMLESAKGTCNFFNLTDKSLLWLPLSLDYIAGKMMMVRADYAKCELYIESPSNFPIRTAPDRCIDLMPIVPSQLPGLMQSPWINAVKNIIIGGAPMSVAAENIIRSANIQAYATFGMTETCSHVALRNITAHSDIYEALPGFSFDTTENSCLIILNKAMSWEKLITRDVVDLVDDTHFKWLGRADNVVNSGGIKLHPELIEKKLGTLISNNFFLTGRLSEKWGEELIMIVEGCDIDCDKIKAEARKVLRPYEMPHEIIVLQKLKRTSSGKIIRTY